MQAGTSTAQKACNIAAFLAEQVVKAGLQKAHDDVAASASFYTAVVGIVDLFAPLAPELALILSGGAILVNAVAGGTLSDYSDALADATLWHNVECAIYLAIVVDGYVKDSNFAALVAAVGGVTYAHSDVITALVDYLNGLGATGVEQLQQTGGIYEGDCSGCGWCYVWTGSTIDTPAWTYQPGYFGTTDVFTINGTHMDSLTIGGSEQLHPYYAFGSPVHVDTIRVVYHCPYASGGGDRGLSWNTGSGHNLNFGAGDFDITVTVNADAQWINFAIDTITGDHINKEYISRVEVRGTGTNPFGASNC